MALEQDIRRLARVPIFAAMNDEALRLVAFSAETRLFSSGEKLFSGGEPAGAAYFVLTGAITLGGPRDERPEIAGPDCLIGEMALIADVARPTDAFAREPSTALRIARPLFRRVLEEFPGNAGRLRDLIAERLGRFAADLDGARRHVIEPGRGRR